MRKHGRSRSRAVVLALAALATAIALYVSWQVSWRSSETPIPDIHAVDLKQRTIYRSPQTPGYTSWVGAWIMPDRSLMTGFIQATGNLDPNKRGLAPRRVVDASGLPRPEPERDFWGLHQTLEYLRSSDGGASWRRVRSEPFKALGPGGFTPQATIALEDGTILRRVTGDDLRHDPAVPHTGYLQRLAPGAKDWSAPQVLMVALLEQGLLADLGPVARAVEAPHHRHQVPTSTLMKAP